MIKRIFKFFGYIPKDEVKIVDNIVEKPIFKEIVKEVIKEKALPVHGTVEAIEIDYILGELTRDAKEAKKEIYNNLRKLDKQTLKLLTELVSKKYRKNAVYDCLYERGYTWSEETINLKDIYLTRINERTNKVLEKLKKPYNLLDLAKAHKAKKLPKRFELTSRVNKVDFMPMCALSEGKFKIMDGNHRITSYALSSNKKTIKSFVGRK